MKNRLQFVHCNTVFKTREDAIKRLSDEQFINRPTLYAEPMIVRYGSESNPNIILAIGSVGEGKESTKNRTFFIDLAHVKEEIEKLQNDVEIAQQDIENIQQHIAQLIESCGFDSNGEFIKIDNIVLQNANNVKEALQLASEYLIQVEKDAQLSVIDSSTIDLNITDAEIGKSLQANVKVPANGIMNDKVKDNHIKILDDGLFVNVGLDYNAKDNTLILNVNDNQPKVISLPEHTNVSQGKYDPLTESLVLTLTNGKEVIVDLRGIHNEWAVDNSNTPIKLNIDRVISQTLENGTQIYNSILKADVDISSDAHAPFNILVKDESNHTLRVDGLASKIFYEDKPQHYITVQQALEETEKSVDDIKLEYDAATNTISLQKDGKVAYQYQLNTGNLVNEMKYDKDTESIVVVYETAANEKQTITIPVSDLIEEWTIETEGHTVLLNRKRNEKNGVDVLTADVKISNAKDNILTVQDNQLYVQGVAEKIQYLRKNSDVESELNYLNDSLANLTNSLNAEKSNRESVDNQIQTNVAKNANDLSNEIIERKNEDSKLLSLINGNSEDIDKLEVDIHKNRSAIGLNNDGSFHKNAGTFGGTANTIGGEISNLDNALSNLSAQTLNINDSLTNVQNQVTTHVQNLNNTIQKEVSDRIAAIKALDADVTGEDNHVKVHVIEVDGIVTSVDVTTTDIASAIDLSTERQRINSVNEQIAAIEVSLNENINKTNANSSEISIVKNNIIDEAHTRYAEDEKLSARIDATNNSLTLANQTIETVNSNVINEIDRAKTAEQINSNEIKVVKESAQKINVTYDALTNKVAFVDFSGKKIEYALNGVQIADEITYDASKEAIIISYKDAYGQVKVLEVPVSGIIEEWEEDNANTTVTLTKTRDAADGKDKLSANVNISTHIDNILQQDGNTLYVKGTADNIKYKNNTVAQSLETLQSSIEDINSNGTKNTADVAQLKEDVKDLQWSVDSSNLGGVILTKNSENVLGARLNVKEDNILKLENGVLYVDAPDASEEIQNELSKLNANLSAPNDNFITGVTQVNGKITNIQTSSVNARQVVVDNPNLNANTVEQALMALQSALNTMNSGGTVTNIISSNGTLKINTTDNGAVDITINNEISEREPIVMDGGEY